MVELLWKMVWRFPQKVQNRITYDAAIPLVGIYPQMKQNKQQKQKQNLNAGSQRDDSHAHVHCNIIHKGQEVETMQVPTDE